MNLGFCCRHTDGRIRIWRQQLESMDPTYFVSTVQASSGGVMVWAIFSWLTLGWLIPNDHGLCATASQSKDLDPTERLLDVVEWEILMGGAAEKYAGTM